MPQVDEVDYQDPILTPGNLRKIVQNLPGKAKHEHTDYIYDCDSDSFEDEINEFFKYTEVTVRLQDYRRLYEKEFIVKHNSNADDDNYKKQHIIFLLDQLEYTEQESRIKACKCLIYISLGCFTADKNELKQKRIAALIEHNKLLIQCGAFHIFYQKLQQSCNKILSKDSHQNQQVGICTEIDLHLTLLYVSIEVQRLKKDKKFRREFVTLEPNFTEYLLNLVAQLRERLSDKFFPIKKIVLLLWKSLLFMSDGHENIKLLAGKEKEKLGLPINKENKDTTTFSAKSTPQDLSKFQDEISNKYPGYIAPELSLFKNIPSCSKMVIDASSSLSTAIGYLKATNNVDLLYETLFPPKLSSSSKGGILNGANDNKKQSQQLQNYFMDSATYGGESPTFILPLTHKGSDVPDSIKEAGDVYISNMYLSLANCQIIQERSHNIQKWAQLQKGDDPAITTLSDEGNNGENGLIDKIYAKTIHNFQNTIIVLLKLLLTSVITASSSNTHKNNTHKNNTHNDSNDGSGGESDKSSSLDNSIENNITLEYIEQVDVIRDKEIYAKAISGILMILLKWTKSSHVLKFEYLSQILVDSGCLLLILKIIGLQDISDLVKAHTDIPYYSFFDYNVNREADSTTREEIKDSSSFSMTTHNRLYTNRRNMYWTINYLRILQMLTKHKSHRIMLLVQYKSSAILKRLLKISHPVLELYILKLLKNQIPYLGKKWRSQNMKIVSAIYLNCRTVLKDDWISKNKMEEDIEEGKMQEASMRILTRLYIGRRYLPSLLPIHDEVYNDQKDATDSDNFKFTVPMGPGFSGFISYNMDILPEDYMDTVQLDKYFYQNYEQWLEDEVYNIDDEKEDKNNVQIDTPAPMTPYPEIIDNDNSSNNTISHERLTYEINKLYIEQLDAEFKPSPPLSFPVVPHHSLTVINKKDEWESPPTPAKKIITPLARYDGDENNLIYIKRNRRRRTSNDSQQSSSSSLSIQQENINHHMQIEDQLLQRLMQVEDRTVQEWLSQKSAAGEGSKIDSRYNYRLLDTSLDEKLRNYHYYYSAIEYNNSSSNHGGSSSSSESGGEEQEDLDYAKKKEEKKASVSFSSEEE